MKSTKEQHTRLLPKAWVLHPSSQGLVSQPYRRFLVSFTFNWRKTKGKRMRAFVLFQWKGNKQGHQEITGVEWAVHVLFFFVHLQADERSAWNEQRKNTAPISHSGCNLLELLESPSERREVKWKGKEWTKRTTHAFHFISFISLCLSPDWLLTVCRVLLFLN